MNRRRTFVTAVVALALTASVAYGFWSGGSTPGGGGSSKAQTVPQGGVPTPSVAGRAVTLTWSAVNLPGGQPVAGYQVGRYDEASSAPQTVLSGCTGTVAGLTCTESNVPDGHWRYGIIPRIGTNWQGPESALSTTALVDQTAPVNDLSLSSVSGGAALVGTTAYYRGSASGGFRITNALTDATSGPARSTTSGLSGPAGGLSHSGLAVTTPAGGPYVSNPFTWTSGTTASPTFTVTGRDVAGNTAPVTLTLTNDSAAPSAGSISYQDGALPGRSVSVTFAAGTDAGSGVAVRRLQRSSAPVSGGSCGSFTAYVDIATDPTSPYVDANRGRGCYRYRLLVRDRVGNQTTATGTSTAQVGYAGAVAATTGTKGVWRLGESGPLTSDSFTGTVGATLQSRTGEVGAGWTNAGFSDSQLTGVTGRIFKSGLLTAGSLYYSSATPGSPDYSVSADVVAVTPVANDAAGVVGRLATGSTTFYAARYDRATGAWVLSKVVNGTSTSLGSWAQAFTIGTQRVTLAMDGTSIRLLVNGVERVAATDSSITAAGRGGTQLGYVATGSPTTITTLTTGLQLDNVLVTPAVVDGAGTNHGAYGRVPTLGVAGALTGDADTAATFDGVDDYASVRRAVSDDLTVEFWFRSTGGTGTGSQWYQAMPLVDSDAAGVANDFGVGLRSDGKVVAGVGNGASETSVVSTATGLNNGAWHHVAATRVRSTGLLTVYVDGAASGSVTAGTTSLTGSPMVFFGASADLTRFLTGSLDEVAVYDQALGGAVVADHYALGSAPVADLAGPTGGSVDATGLVGTGSRYSTSTTLNLALSAGSDPSGLDSATARLDRATAPLTGGSCGTYGEAETIATAPTSPRTDVVDDGLCYRYEYVVSDTQGNGTTYTSGDIKVDTTAPGAVALTPTSGSGSYVSGSQVYYRPAAATRTFTVTANVTENESGIASYGFPTIGAGWSATGTGNSRQYTWPTTSTVSGAQTVTATSNAGVAASPSGSFTVTPDSTAPTTSVTYTGGIANAPAVSVTTAASDAGSGLASVTLERGAATLTGASTCGAFTWSLLATNPAASYADTLPSTGCYQYRLTATDQVGNTFTTATGATVINAGLYENRVTNTTGLVNYWRLGEASGTAAADATGGANGTYTSSTLNQAGALNGDTSTSVTFNGTSSFVSAPRQIGNSFSIELWFKSTQNVTAGNKWRVGAALFDSDGNGNGADFGFSLDGSQISAGVANINPVTGGTGLNNGQWHQVVFTRNQTSGALVLYVDGAQVATGTGPTTALTASAVVNIGRSTQAARYFNGTIDEVSTYSTVLPAATVLDHFNNR